MPNIFYWIKDTWTFYINQFSWGWIYLQHITQALMPNNERTRLLPLHTSLVRVKGYEINWYSGVRVNKKFKHAAANTIKETDIASCEKGFIVGEIPMPYKDLKFFFFFFSFFPVEPEDSFLLRFLPTGRWRKSIGHFTITEWFPEHGLANFYDQ